MNQTLERYPRVVRLKDGSEVTLRPLEAGDTARLEALFAHVQPAELQVMRDDVRDPAVVRRFTEMIDFERVIPVVAVVGDEFVGELSLHRRPDTPQAGVGQLRLYVREEWRRRGLGSTLIDEAIELGRDVGLEQLVVELFLDNAAMISAFERRGFVREAILTVYQLVVMRYDLARRPGRDVLAIDHADMLPSRRHFPDLIFPETLEIPERFNLCELLLDRNVARGWGRRPAIYFRDEIVTYELLLGEVCRFASSLAGLGVAAGDPVLLHLPNTSQAIAANLAVQRLGALSVPTITRLEEQELAYIINESGARIVVTTPDRLAQLRRCREAAECRLETIVVTGGGRHEPAAQIYDYARLVAAGSAECPPVERARSEIALLLYTSAMGGHPRGTAHRLDGLLAAVDLFGNEVWRVNEEDIVGTLAPLGFAQGFVTWGLLPFRFGAAVGLPREPLADSGPELVQAIKRHRITLLLASPTTYREILADPSVGELDLASLRLCSSHGEALTIESYEAWERRFYQPIFEGFGTTEMLYAFLSNAIEMQPRPGALGRVVPGFEVKIVGDMGHELSTGEIGTLVVRGPTGTLYWNDPAAQEQSVRNGWSRLPDFAYMDRDGYFWYVARNDDLIKSRSYRIDPNEVEAALKEHPNVVDAAVIGLPDPLAGQRAVGYVILDGREPLVDGTRRRILASLSGRLADYKIPEELVFVETLPRDAAGRPLRRALRERVRQQQ